MTAKSLIRIEKIAESPDDLTPQQLVLLANGMGMKEAELRDWWAKRESPPPPASHRTGHFIPIINKTPAGPARDYEDVGHNHYDHLPMSPEMVGDPEAFAVEVIGDSMTPEFQPGDKIILSPRLKIRDGDVVFVRFDGSNDGECCLKRAFDLGDQVRLESDNKRHRPVVVAKESIIRMSRVRGKFVDYGA